MTATILGMNKTSIYLTDEQIERLQKVSTSTGISQAILIRRFIDLGLHALERTSMDYNVLRRLDEVERAIEKKKKES